MLFGRSLRLCACALLSLVALTSAALTSAAWAQLPATQLNSVFPPGGKAGTTLDVALDGNDLEQVDRLVFSHPGITAAAKMGAPSEFDPAPRPLPNQFTVTIAGDVPPGRYEATAVGRFGMSNPRAFAIGTLNEVVDAGGNNVPEKALEVPVGSTVSGRVDANQYDYLRLNLKQGERVILDCAAERIDSRLNATLVLLDPAGREIDRVRDSVRQDPVLDFTAPAAGAYSLKLYDAVYAGGADYFYRLEVSAAPLVDFVFPPSGPAGSNNPYTIYGRNLPGGQPAEGLSIAGNPLQKVQVNIALPADEPATTQLDFGGLAAPRRAWQDGIEYRLPTPQGPASPVTVYFSKTASQVVEQEPNDEPAAATKLTLPCEMAGQFYPERDRDWVQFDAKKGETYWIEAISHQMGTDADPTFGLYRITKNDKGEEQVAEINQTDDAPGRQQRIGRDFDTTSDDPSFKFVVPENGTYRLLVRDQFGDSRKDPSSVYRLEIRPAQPDFRLLVHPDKPAGGQRDQNQTRLESVTVRKGGTTVMTALVNRQDDFAGDIALSVEGLPAGISCVGAVLGGDVTSAPLVLVAAEGAAAWTGPIQVVGKAKLGEQEVVREARYAVVVWGTPNRQQQRPDFRLVKTMQLGVIDNDVEPAFVQIGEDKVWETSLGGNVEIPIAMTRRGDFKEAVKLVAEGLPNEIKPKEVNLDGNTAAGKFELSLNQQKTQPGIYTFYMRGDTKRKYVRNPDAVPAAEAEQKQITETIAQLTEGVKTATAVKDQATKSAQELAAAAKAAEQKKNEVAEELAAAEKALADAAAAAKAAEEARIAAEAALKASQDKLAAANTFKQTVDKKVADAKQANQPKDLNFALVSTPIKLRIHPHPFALTAASPPAALKQAEKQELLVKVERLFGFAEQVDLTFTPPDGVKGLAAQNVTLNKDQADGKLDVTAAADTPVGQHACTVRCRGKFNNVQVETTATVMITVEAK